jgi:arylsulfatase A-like enzyme
MENIPMTRGLTRERGTDRRWGRWARPFFVVLVAVLAVSTTIPARQVGAPPNVVILLADDAGWNDVGYHGSEIRTPNIDRLAREGVALDAFYVHPTCSPTRAALLTGRPASRFGIDAPIAGQSRDTLPRDALTLAQLLQRAGYHTAITGKWHLGLSLDAGPQTYGFDHAFGALHGQVDPYTHRYKFGDETWHRNGRFVREEGHATDLIAAEAIRFVREIRDPARPFFLYVAFTVPHYPLDEPADYVRPYEAQITNESRRKNAAAMTHMDAAIGSILDALEDQGVRRNTLVVFASDNGGQRAWTPTSAEYEGRYPVHDRLGDNAPLRGWKVGLYEGGIRVPAVVHWPGRLQPRTVAEPITVSDLFPTVAALARTEPPTSASIEGMNVWPVLERGGPLPERPLYIRVPDGQSLRLGEWKLIHHGPSPEKGRDELFHIASDPTEQHDVAASRPEVLARLRAELVRQVQADR